MLIDLFLHEGLEDLARAAPGRRALEDNWDLAINDLIPLLNVRHSPDMRLLRFATTVNSLSGGLVIRAKGHMLN